jgi:hypothetical protein
MRIGVLISLVLLAGCPVSRPAPKTGLALTYDGTVFQSDNGGRDFERVLLDRTTPDDDVALIFPDGFEIHPLKLTPEIAREHAESVTVNGDDGEGGYRLLVDAGKYCSLYGRYENHRARYLSLSGASGFETTIKVRVRGEEFSMEVEGRELNERLGKPDAMENYAPVGNPH